MAVDPASLAIKAAMTAASMALTALQKFEGPRLDDLGVTTADYGTPLSYLWGLRRLEGRPIIWAEKLREKKTTSKTKGGKYSQYKYFGTFAVAVADQEIDAVTRIWMDKHLVYDATNVGPISVLGGLFQGLNGPVKITRGRNMRIYLGTETQEPDPRMEAWCEDRYGPDSCPAYRGVSYIVFEELPLEKFGNRIPQVTVEAVRQDIVNYPTASLSSSAAGLDFFFFSPSYGRIYHFGRVYDTATRTKIRDGSETRRRAFNEDGTFYVDNGADDMVLFSTDGVALSTLDVTVVPDAVSGAKKAGNLICLYRFPNSLTGAYYWDEDETIYEVPTSVPIKCYFTGNESETFAIGGGNGFFRIYELPGGNYHEVVSTENSTTCHAFANGEEGIVVVHGNSVMLVSTATWTVTAQTDGVSGISAEWAFANIAQGTPTFWLATSEYSSTTVELIRTITTSNWGSFNGSKVYDPINHALIDHNSSSGVLTWLFLDRPGSNGVTLGTVVDEVAEKCGLADVDVTDLTQIVQGYSTTQGSGKDWVQPLLDIHDAEARPHDFTAEFINRGGAIQGTIETSEYVREGDEARYTVTIAQDTDLPRKVSLTFADQDKDQQPNTVISQRPLDSADTVREQTIDLSTYTATPGDAQKFADRYFRRKWNERETSALALTAQYLGMEPGDAWNIDLDGVTRYARIKKMTLSQGRLALEFVRDAVSFATLGTGTGAAMEGRDPEELFIPGPTKGFVMDVPLVEDVDSNTNPLLYYGAGSYGGDFPGATIFEVDLDANEYDAWNGVEAADRAVWGYATDALADANPNVWDRGNSVNVLGYGTLTSCTEADIDADPTLNMAAIGINGRWEFINFTTATLESDGSYTLSGFKRGRRGTEWATADHAVGDEFVLVSSLESEGLGLSDVGTALTYRAQTIGRDPADASDIDVDFSGATLKPYAPARLKIVYDGTDLDCEIIRRTRVGGAWTGGSTIPVSEIAEAYEVDVYNGATFKRTITVSGTNLFTYTAAMAATDGITLPTPPTFQVYQMSDAVGRGFALAA